MSGDRLELRYVPLRTLMRWDRNAKVHDLPTLAASIGRHGFRDPPAYDAALNGGDGGIVEGNGRSDALSLLRANGDAPPRGIVAGGDDWLVPVLFGLDAPSQAAAEAYAVDHNNTTMAGLMPSEAARLWEPEGYAALLESLAADGALPVSVDDGALEALLAELAGDVEPGGGGDEFDTTPNDGPTRAQLGDLWIIGGVHRLIVGDSADPATIARLMQGERARFEFADPPYELDTRGGGVLKKSAHMRAIEGAGINTFDPSGLVMIAPTAVFCCNKPLVPAYLELAKVLGVSWDICFYAKSNTPPNYGGHMMTDVEYLMLLGDQSPISGQDKALYSKAYFGGIDSGADVAWQKPVGLVEKFISIYSQPGEIVADRFAGTGTTLIAAHRTGRRCYGAELSPRYADVILRRCEAEGLTCVRAE